MSIVLTFLMYIWTLKQACDGRLGAAVTARERRNYITQGSLHNTEAAVTNFSQGNSKEKSQFS